MDDIFSGSYYNPYYYNDKGRSSSNRWPYYPDPKPGHHLVDRPKPELAYPKPTEPVYGPSPNNRSSYFYYKY